jgi:hypothetical protein
MLNEPMERQLTYEQLTLARNFTLALESSGVRPGDIAAACGITEQAVSNWKRTGKIGSKNLAVVVKLTGWSMEQLFGNEPAPSNKGGAFFSEEPKGAYQDIKLTSREIPTHTKGGLILETDSRHHVGDLFKSVSWEQLMDAVEKGTADFTAGVWATVNDDSMTPLLSPGDRVLLKSIAPLPGDEVLAMRNGNELMIRSLRWLSKDRYELVPLNPSYGQIRSDDGDTHILAVVVEYHKFKRRQFEKT